MPDLSVSNEGTVLGPFADRPGRVPGQLDVRLQQLRRDDAGASTTSAGPATRQTVEGEESRPPIGGINVGIGAFTDEPEFALEAVQCITSLENQVQYAIETANMPAREAAYDDAGLQEQFPADLLELYRDQHRLRRAPAGVAVLGDDRQRHPQRVAPGRRR